MGIKTTAWVFSESPVQCFDWNTWKITQFDDYEFDSNHDLLNRDPLN